MAENELQEQVALFRYGIIADFVHLPPGSRGLYAQIRKKAGQEYVIPGSRRTRVAEETIRSWLKKYRKGGFDALLPKERTDKGETRKLPLEISDLLLEAKEKEPELTVPLLIKKVRASGNIPDDVRMPRSTVYKLLARHGLTRKITSPDRDHRRFAYLNAGDLFMSDVMYGPAVRKNDGRKRKTYLIAFIDDATRVIPYAAPIRKIPLPSWSVETSRFKRGIPMRLFV
ncbi:conserved domain protein, partial [delta proteobacterium NaphS2]